MAGSEKDPEKNARPDDESRPDPILAWIDEYLRLEEAGDAPPIDVFAERIPPEHRRAALEVLGEIVRTPVRAGGGSVSGGDTLIGKRLGDFDVQQRVGRGAMGTVYLAHQRSLDRKVALKVMAPGLVDGERAMRRFRLEAKVAARLRHPHLVRVHQVGEEDGVEFLVMEFVDGASLHEVLHAGADLPTDLQPLVLARPAEAADFRKVAALIADVADGLAHVHEHGIIHRDVKPQNILVDREGGAHLTDFGLAKDVREASISQRGDLAGTYFYMSPEQAHGKVVPVDHRTDIFSLGVVLYEMLTHERPFRGQTSQQILYAISFREPQPLPRMNARVPASLAAVCSKALEKKPHHRYATAAEFAADLRRFVNGEPVLARPPSALRRVGRAVRRRRLLTTAVVTAIIVGLLGWWGFVQYQHAQSPKLLVHSDTLGARIVACSIDEISGQLGPPLELGETADPPATLYLARGRYRVFVAADADHFAELTVELADEQPVDVRAWVRPSTEVTKGMVRIEAGGFEFGADNDDEPYWHYRRRQETLPAFDIDECEVSNEQYRAFCKATGNKLPPWLEDDEYDPAWDDRPVVMLRWENARRYAEWAGKRLPTLYEWQVAARGRDGADLPPGISWEDAQSKAVLDRMDAEWGTDLTVEERYAYAMARLAPVASTTADRSVFGLRHVLGNVSEWTDSAWIVEPRPEEGRSTRVFMDQRVLMGSSWSQPVEGLGRPDQLVMQSAAAELGFRCARSVAPPH